MLSVVQHQERPTLAVARRRRAPSASAGGWPQYAGGIAVPSRQLLLTCAAGAFGLGWQNMLVIIVPLRALELAAPASING